MLLKNEGPEEYKLAQKRPLCGRLGLRPPPFPGRQGRRPHLLAAPPLGAAPPLPLFRERFPFISDLSFVLHLALATLEHTQISAVLVYSELHLRVIIRLLASFSCLFFDCGQETIFVIRLILHQQGR